MIVLYYFSSILCSRINQTFKQLPLRDMASNKTLIRFNSAMAMLCTLLMIGIPIAMAWFWLNFDSSIESLSIYNEGILQLETIVSWQIVTASSFSLLGSLIFAYGLFQLRKLFINFTSREYFTQPNLECMYRFSLVLFITATLKLFDTAVMSLVLTWNNPPGERALSVTLGSNEFWSLFIAATFLAITWSFREGVILAKENAEFV